MIRHIHESADVAKRDTVFGEFAGGLAGFFGSVMLRPRRLPSRVHIETGQSGLAHTSYAKGEDIKTVSQGRLVTRYGLADLQAMRQLETILRTLLEL
ncbi:MAG: hypothetical protein ACYCV4_13600 [Dermatophilaceae bacterium]